MSDWQPSHIDGIETCAVSAAEYAVELEARGEVIAAYALRRDAPEMVAGYRARKKAKEPFRGQARCEACGVVCQLLVDKADPGLSTLAEHQCQPERKDEHIYVYSLELAATRARAAASAKWTKPR